MYKVDGNTVINTVEDLLPVFNNNTEMTVAALNILEKKVGKLSRKMKVTGGMLKQMDIQRQRIDILEGLVKDTHNTAINTKDKDEEM